jgi:excinuclease ABC subunit C
VPPPPEGAPLSGERLIESIPRRMGVYLLKDERERIIYIGKAVDLRSRVRTHLGGLSPHPKAALLARRIAAVDYIPCETEVEALILEQNLIKEHRPRFNVELKDDKRYPYLKLTREDFPRLFKTRDLTGDGARYYGPFTSVGAMEEMVKTILAIFPLRTCDWEIPYTDPSMRECLEFHIGRCEAPCTRRQSRDEYARLVDQVALFLEGHTGELLSRLETEMATAARQRNYEQAGRLRDRLKAIRRATERQRVVSDRREDFDVFALAREASEGVGVIFQVREGRLSGRDTYLLAASLGEEDEQLLGELMIRHYLRSSHVPPAVYLPRPHPERTLLAGALSLRAGHRVRVVAARTGAAAEVAEMAATDARFRLRDRQVRRAQRGPFIAQAVAELQRELDLPRPPRIIEAFDVSHLRGRHAVAAMVRFRNGEPQKSAYRRFRLKEAAGGDDPAGIAEAVRRRYSRLLVEEGSDGLPDLVLIDGGAVQLAAAVRELDALGLDRGRLPVIGLAKRLEEIYLPGAEGPQSPGRSAPAIRLLQRVRDEVHRFAVGYHRRQRAGRVRATLLTEVPGIGEGKARRLLQAFGSVTRMLQSGEEAIARTPGIGPRLARRIVDAMGEAGRSG